MEFNSIGFCVFGIPAYFFCSVVGAVVATCVFIVMLESKNYNLEEHMKALGISVIGLIVFAKMFGCFTGIYKAIGSGEAITFETIKNTGIVFYGGLIGLLTTYSICIRSRLITEKDYHVLDILSVTIPLFHAIGRVGCFLGGCCYGIEKDTLVSVLYTTFNQGIKNTTFRIPIQLIESSFNVLLFIYLFKLSRTDDWKNKHILYRYLILYSAARFFFEFVRGDTVRGIIHGVSFSQVISLIIMICVFVEVKKNRI